MQCIYNTNLCIFSMLNFKNENKASPFIMQTYLVLQLQDVKPDVVTYTTLMKALIRVDKFNKVEQIMALAVFRFLLVFFYTYILPIE